MPIEVVTTYRLTCSRPSCLAALELSGGAAIKEGQEAGWLVDWASNTPDLCPAHKPVDEDDPQRPHYRVEIRDGVGGLTEISPGARVSLVPFGDDHPVEGFVFEWAYMQDGVVQLVVLDRHQRRMQWRAADMQAAE